MEAEPWTPASLTRSKSSTSPDKLRTIKRSESFKATSPVEAAPTSGIAKTPTAETPVVTDPKPPFESPFVEEPAQPVSLSPSNLTRSLERGKNIPPVTIEATPTETLPNAMAPPDTIRISEIRPNSQPGSDRDNSSKYSTSPAFIAPSRYRPRPLSKDYSNTSTSPPFSALPRSISANLSSSRYRKPVQSVFSDDTIDHKGSPTTSTSFNFASIGSDYDENAESMVKSIPIQPTANHQSTLNRNDDGRRLSSGAGSVGSTGAASVLLRRFSVAVAESTRKAHGKSP